MPQPKLTDTVSYPLYVVIGLFLWAGHTFAFRYLDRALETSWIVGSAFAGTFVLALILVMLTRATLRPNRLVEAFAVIAGAALAADAMTVTFAPFWLGSDERLVRLAAGWRLWTGASLLVSAILLEHRPMAAKN